MGDEIIGNRWDSSTGFLIAMIGAIIGLSGIWKFSYLMYENGGGTFLIPYILAIVIMAIPILVLEFGVGFKFKSSLPKVFYNIKSEFEIIAWFIVFLIFIVLIYYTCIMSWDLIYIVLSLFKGWGSNPSVFFTTTLLHSTSNPYGLTYLVVPIGVGLIVIWALIYLFSRKEINKGILTISKISLILSFVLLIGMLLFALQLPGSRTGIMALFNPNWSVLLDLNVWLAAFGQLIFSYGLGYAIASTYSSYLGDNAKLIDNAWIIVLVSLVFEVLVSVLLFAIMGYMALGRNIPITSLVSDSFSLIFVVFPNVFNIMDPWVYMVAPAFFLLIFVGSLSTVLALIEPLSNAISEKFGWTRDRAVRQLVLVGLFLSFIFATGMGEYLLRITDSFITQFAIILGVLLEIIVLGWVYDIEDIRSVLNGNSYIKVDKSWVITIKFILPIILTIIWILGVYNLILVGDRQSLLVQSVIASIFVIVPLALTVIPYKGDYSLDLSDNKAGVNYFKEKEYVEKTIDDYAEEDHNPLFDKNGSFVSPYKSLRNRFKRDDNDDEEMEDAVEEDKSRSRRLNRFGSSRSKSGKNVLRNVDLSSEEFDSPYDEDFDDKYNRYDYDDSDYDGSNYGAEDSHSSDGKKKSKSLFDKINMFNRDKGGADLDDEFEDVSFDDDFGGGDYIAPIRDGEDTRKPRHTFKSSKDADVFDNLDDYVEKPKAKPKSKSKSKSKAKTKSESKPKSPKKPKVEEPPEEEYEDFSDDFFDDGVFGDEGYESLLDDYVEKPKAKPKSSKKKSKSVKRESSDDEDRYYDYEGKGADSVFNLDD
jgi:NSS family neurotransmitter:Na+ symporter